jgi:hypothetical protein
LSAGLFQLGATATAAEAAGCTRLTGTIKGSDGAAVNAQIGVDLVSPDGQLMRVAGYDGPYGITPVNVNPGLPATGSAPKGHDLSWSTGCFGIPAGAGQLAVEVYPKAPVRGRPTDKSKYGAVEIHGITAQAGTIATNLVLPVRAGNGHQGNTGNIDGYVHYNGHPLPGADVNGNKQFKVKLWPVDTSSTCGSHGWSADSDNDWTDDPTGFFQVDALAAGQCGATSQAYTIHLECDSTVCGAEAGRSRTYTPSPDLVSVTRGKTTFWSFDLFGPSKAVQPLPPTPPSLATSAASLPAAGGQVTLTAEAALASGITLASVPALSTAGQTVPVNDVGAASAVVTIPPNTTTAPISYRMTATATSSIGDTPGASVTVVQAPVIAYSVSAATGRVYQLTGSAWQGLDDVAMRSVVASSDGGVYGLDRADGVPYRYTSAGWVEIGNRRMSSLAAGTGGLLYGTTAAGEVYSYSGQPCRMEDDAPRCDGWQTVSDIAMHAVSVGSDGTLYGIANGTETVWQDTVTGGWQQIDAAAASSLIVTGSEVFVVHRRGGEVLQYTGSPCKATISTPQCDGWQEIDNGFMTGVTGGDGTVYATDRLTGATYAYTGQPCALGDGLPRCGGWAQIGSGFLTRLSAGNGAVYAVDGVTGVAYAHTGQAVGDAGGCVATRCGGWAALPTAPGPAVVTAG